MSRFLTSMKLRRVVGAATAAVALVSLASLGEVDADQGNWTQGCAAGWACFVSPNGLIQNAAYQKDSSMVTDTYIGDGSIMGDRVKYIENRMVSIGARPYQHPSYGVPYSCIPKDVPSSTYHGGGPYPLNTSTGISSWQGC